MTEENNNGIPLKCTRPDCGYKWTYRGHSRFYCSCPMCHTSVNIRNQIKDKKR